MHDINSNEYRELCAREDAVARVIAADVGRFDVDTADRLIDEAGLPATSRAIVMIKAQRIGEGRA